MNDDIVILISQDNTIQMRLAMRLEQLFVEKKVGRVEVYTTKTWQDHLFLKTGSPPHARSGFNVVIDLSADTTNWDRISSAGYLPIVLGGYLNMYLQPFCQASGIREVGDRSPNTDFVIVSPGRANSLNVWLHVSLPTLRTWQQNQQQLLAACADYTAHWWQRCRHSKKALRLGAVVECRGVSIARSSKYLKLRILLRRTFDRVCSRLHRALRRSQCWQVGWLELGQNKVSSVHHLPKQGSIWFADPYIWRDQQQRLWILCEHYDDEGDRRGRIALLEITAARQALSRGIIIEEHFHLSFPRLIEHHGQLYCTVESYQNSDVRLYASDLLTEGWKLSRILLTGEAYIDPMLFLHEDGYWYLFVNTTSVPSLKREVAPELRLFFCADLLNGEFCEHPESPLLISSRGGRNGGMLALDQLYRVGQQTGYGGVYGESVALFRIDELSTTTYRETPVHHPPTGFQLGWLVSSLRANHLHTLNNHGRVFVFDFMSS